MTRERFFYITPSGRRAQVDGIKTVTEGGLSISVQTTRGLIVIPIANLIRSLPLTESSPAQKRGSRAYDQRRIDKGYMRTHVWFTPEVADIIAQIQARDGGSRDATVNALIRTAGLRLNLPAASAEPASFDPPPAA